MKLSNNSDEHYTDTHFYVSGNNGELIRYCKRYYYNINRYVIFKEITSPSPSFKNKISIIFSCTVTIETPPKFRISK